MFVVNWSVVMTKHKTIKLSPREDAVSKGYIAVLVGFILAYFVAEVSLYGRPHYFHWLASFSAAAIVGVVTYQIVLRRRSKSSGAIKATKR